MEQSIQSTIVSLQQIYAIVIALSVGEVFKQFIIDPGSPPHRNRIKWDRLPLLICFLILVVPFYQGMYRYLCDVYSIPSSRPASYGGWLLFDCAVFTAEASLFFILSRSLPQTLWRQFFYRICPFDSWYCLGSVVWKARTNSISVWVMINLWFCIPLAAILLIFRKQQSCWGIALSIILIFIRSVVDYYTEWALYFPKWHLYRDTNHSVQNIKERRISIWGMSKLLSVWFWYYFKRKKRLSKKILESLYYRWLAD